MLTIICRSTNACADFSVSALRVRSMNIWLPISGWAQHPWCGLTEQAKALRRSWFSWGEDQPVFGWLALLLHLLYRGSRISTARFLYLVIYMGFVPNYEKCDLLPSQIFDFIGTHYVLPCDKVPTAEITDSILDKVAQVKIAWGFMLVF